MNDERRQQPTVNLQELERQLREAARARQRAQASVDTLTGIQSERAPSAPPQGGVQGSASAFQPGLPLSPAPAPAPMPSSAPAAAPTNSSFRPLQSSAPMASPARDFSRPNPPVPSPVSPRDVQPTYQPPIPPRAREPQPGYSPASSFSSQTSDLPPEIGNVLKTDRMADIYPTSEPDPVERGQYYEAAAYEEPASSAYDQYTDDQFPRMSVDRGSNGLLKGAIWVLIVAVIGAGVYFAYPLIHGLFVPSNQTAKAPPLIKADNNPVKVAPETQPQDEASAPKDIFTKHANEDPKAAQMAAGAEQPVDMNAAAKNAAQSAPNGKPVVVPLVPGTGEPRLVKTVTVRADGTIISEKSDPALVAKTQPVPAKATAAPQIGAPVAAGAPGLPPLPTTPVAESPDFNLEGGIPMPPERIVDAAEPEFDLPLNAITTPMPAAPAPEPVDTPTPAAAPAAAPVASAPGKDFTVQFGAPETEAKGNELKARIEKQFGAALTGGTMAVVKGDSNGKPVFRVRAIGYSREEATAVCQQVTAAGGQCFVSKNN